MINSISRDKCCGCEACVQACAIRCIYMVEDDEGFLFPKIDFDRCVKCNRCEKVCPVVNQTPKIKPKAGYAYRTKDESLLLKTSSGGFFTAAAQKVLAQGGVVFGAAFDNENQVVHTYIESIDNLDSLRRSKYVQSKIGNAFADCLHFLKLGRKVLFCGTPCQIKALNLFLGKKYENLVTIDFVCHGVPSPGIFRSYLNELSDVKGYPLSELHNINFRDKGLGFAYSFSCSFSSAFFRENPKENIFLKGFLSDIFLRRSCYNCEAKGFTSGADYTMCDFWGISQKLPQFPSYKIPGVSQVYVIRDALGIFESIDKSEMVLAFDLSDRRIKPAWIENSVPLPSRRLKFFSAIASGMSIMPATKKYGERTKIERFFRFLFSCLSYTLRKVGVK